LLCEKSESLNSFREAKAVVELNFAKIKCVNLDKGGEFYGRYDET